MNRRLGGGKQPTGTPSLAWSTVVVVASLLAGASVVHNIYKPDLSLPPVEIENQQKNTEKQEAIASQIGIIILVVECLLISRCSGSEHYTDFVSGLIIFSSEIEFSSTITSNC